MTNTWLQISGEEFCQHYLLLLAVLLVGPTMGPMFAWLLLLESINVRGAIGRIRIQLEGGWSIFGFYKITSFVYFRIKTILFWF